MKRALALVAVALLVLPAAAKDTAADEAKLKSQVAAEVVKAAAACAAAGAKTEGLALVAEAAALDPAAAGLDDAKSKAEGLDADADGAAAAATKARAAAKAKVAPLYDKLGDLDHAPADENRFLDYSIRAFQWDPKPRAPALMKKAKESLDSPQPWTGARIMAKLRKADPDGTKAGKYDAFEVDLAKSNKLMLGCADNPMVAWVSFPKDWSKTKKMPVAVGVEGAGCGFAGYFGGLVGSRGSRGVICVTPVTVTNTNADNLNPKTYPMYDPAWLDVCKTDLMKRIEVEGPGMETILADLTERFGADDRAFHTGFSGGGIYTYWRLFQHPDKVRGAAPACGNFGGLGLQGAPGAKDGGPAVLLMTGEKDPHRDFTFGDKNQPGIEPQTNNAQENLTKLGYTNVKRFMFPGVGHSSLHSEFWKFVDEVLAGKFGK
ncbi:MAG: hypothetical protein K8T90_11070 [Planctomycetes bacterium]|nr:hypothetical protein [Planctomycetota bacterium]